MRAAYLGPSLWLWVGAAGLQKPDKRTLHRSILSAVPPHSPCPSHPLTFASNIPACAARQNAHKKKKKKKKKFFLAKQNN